MMPSISENDDKNIPLKPSNLELITTGDGSSSLLNTELNDFYHSTKGAIGESMHVYIEQGLDYFMKGILPASTLKFSKSDLEQD